MLCRFCSFYTFSYFRTVQCKIVLLSLIKRCFDKLKFALRKICSFYCSKWLWLYLQIFIIKQVLHGLQSCDNSMAPTIVMEKNWQNYWKGIEPKNFTLFFFFGNWIFQLFQYNCLQLAAENSESTKRLLCKLEIAQKNYKTWWVCYLCTYLFKDTSKQKSL